MHFQRRGVGFALSPLRRGRVLIADEMGTGIIISIIIISIIIIRE